MNFMPMALGRRPKAREHLIFLYTPHAVHIHTKIGTVNIDFGGALFRSTTPRYSALYHVPHSNAREAPCCN